jgi:hypothetical protein
MVARLARAEQQRQQRVHRRAVSGGEEFQLLGDRRDQHTPEVEDDGGVAWGSLASGGGLHGG